jgi:ATP-dependent Clp protease adapter protein ClpS
MERPLFFTPIPRVRVQVKNPPKPETGPWQVVLYNDQVHTMAEVVQALVKATGFELIRCAKTTMEAHLAGRAIVTRTDETSAERIVGALVNDGLLAAVRPA